MKKIFFVVLLSLGILTQSQAGGLGLLKSEKRDGMNKICIYDVSGKTYTLTIMVTETCLLTYNF